ncbi:MAG: translocation/assembly module TamB domain-containing protein [Acidobacteriia bacterium]|nr:translocation/assembly module TamB domain-containing protein [Terriglobia bacterium]
MSKRLRRTGLALGALAALLALAFAAMSTPWFQRMLERRVVQNLEALTGGRVEVQRFRFRPLVLQVILRGLVLHGRQLPGESPLFTAGAVVVRIKPLSLIRRKLLLQSLDWDTVEIHLYMRPDGSTNLGEAPAPWEGGDPVRELMNLEIEQLSLVRTLVIWNEARLPLDLDAQNAAILLRHDPARGYLGSLSTSGVQIKFRRRSLPPVSLSAQFHFSGQGLEVSPMTWQCAGVRGQGTFTLSNWYTPQTQSSFHAEGGAAGLAKALGLRTIQGGTLKVDGSVATHKGEFTAQGRLQARQVSLETPAVRMAGLDFSTEYSADSHRVELPNFSLSALGGSLQGRAEISLQDPSRHFSLRANVQNLPLEAALRSLTTVPTAPVQLRPTSQLSGTVEASGNDQLKDFRSRFDIELDPGRDVRAGTLPLGGFVRGTVTLAPAFSLQLREANVTTPHSTLTAQGILSAQETGLTLQASTSDFEEWRPAVGSLGGATEPLPFKLRSEATFSGQLSGTFARPEIAGRFEVGRFEYRGWAWDGLRAELHASPDRLEIPKAIIRRAQSSVSLAGTLPLADWKPARQGPLQLTARVDHTALEGLTAALDVPYPLSGFASGYLNVEGTLSELSGKGTVRIERLVLAEEPFDSFSADLGMAGPHWDIEEIQLAKGPGRMTGHVRVDPSTRHIQGELHGKQFALADFKYLTEIQKGNRPRVWGGSAAFDLTGEGLPENVTLAGTWDLQKVSLNGATVGDLHGRIEGEGKEFRLQGRMEGPGGELHFAGNTRREGDWPLELSGEFLDFHAEPWLRSFIKNGFDAHVTASGSLTVRGPIKDPARFDVATQVRDLEIKFPSLSWKNDGPVEIRYANRRITAGQFRLRGPATDLVVEGSVNLAKTAELSLSAQGMADATLLNLFDPQLQASGKSELRLRATGDLRHPFLNGKLSVQDVSLGYADLPFRLTGLQGEIALEGDRATVKSLHATSGGGSVTMTGFATLGDTLRFNVLANLSQVRMRYPQDFTSVLDGDLRLVGSPAHAQLGGELTVRQMFVSENFNWLAWIVEAGGAGAAKPPGIASPYAAKIRLNVQVGAAPAVRVEARDLRLVGDIDLRLQGTLANPVQVGTIQILSGEAVFRGNRYKINRGDISMTNPFRTQPVIDVEAQTRIQRYDLTVTVTGPVDRLRLSYRSDPPLPTVDIVSLLAFGYARQQEEMSTSASHPVSTVGASALLSEALSTQVSGRIQRLFGVSRIKIDPNVGALAGATGGARITVEQQVTRDLTLTYVTTTSSSQQRIIQFEWALSDRVSLLGARDQNGVFGVELKFRQRFK